MSDCSKHAPAAPHNGVAQDGALTGAEQDKPASGQTEDVAKDQENNATVETWKRPLRSCLKPPPYWWAPNANCYRLAQAAGEHTLAPPPSPDWSVTSGRRVRFAEQWEFTSDSEEDGTVTDGEEGGHETGSDGEGSGTFGDKEGSFTSSDSEDEKEDVSDDGPEGLDDMVPVVVHDLLGRIIVTGWIQK
ncbi:hypothetical protein VTI74DRAFT_8277 [Chaetomium olivicolor]